MLYIGANMVESLSNSDLDFFFKLYILTLNTETLVSKSKYWIFDLLSQKYFPRLLTESIKTGISFQNTDCEPSSVELSNQFRLWASV